MNYETVLAKWGEKKIRENWYRGTVLVIDPETVQVTLVFDKGFACCGGSNPDCYCSLAESPRAEVSITARTFSGTPVYCKIEANDFDFTAMLRELVEVADGAITA